MSEAARHVTELADRIGPRPATTDAEAMAGDYIEDVFRSRGLEVTRQEFESPRTASWGYSIYHLLTIASVGLLYWAEVWDPLRWILFGAAAIAAVFIWLDLDMRFGLSGIMPKGPSQNIIARHIPKTRRAEKVKRVVLVAHYDSARASLASSPSMAKRFPALIAMIKGCTFLVPVMIFVDNLAATRIADPYLWYATLVVAACLLIPLAINIHRELLMRGTDGANDNASGVAALLGLAETLVPEPEGGVKMPTQPLRPLQVDYRGSEGSQESAPEQASYEEELPDDFQWVETPRKKGSEPPSKAAVSGWLGVDPEFDARKAGKDIGHWDNFEDDDEDEEFGTLRGWAGDDPIGDPDFPANEAARIRQRVTERIDRSVVDKELWFVATGAHESGAWGMRAFLDEYGDDLRDAYIINLDSVGAGNLHWVTREGAASRYASDRRLISLARKVSRDEEILAKGREYRGVSTDATPALARRLKAISIMAFDINGRILNWRWHSDVSENVQPENVESAVKLVTGIIREL